MPHIHNNQHVVETTRQQWLAEGRLRDCTSLALRKVPSPSGVNFMLVCEDQSFLFRPRDTEADFRKPEGEPRSEAGPECPPDCRFFVDRVAAERSRRTSERRALWANRTHALLTIVPRFLNWYAQAPWQTQVFILLVTLAAFAPHWLDPVARVVKAWRCAP